MMKIMGIDPGYDGAIAILASRDDGFDISVWDLPTYALMVNKKHKRRLDLYAIATWMDLWSAGVDKVVIENPNALPGQGITSAFNFGGACLALQMAVAAQGLSVRLVPPAVWKHALHLPHGEKTDKKDASRRLAVHLYPKTSPLLTRKKDHNRAEAILLAHYGTLIP